MGGVVVILWLGIALATDCGSDGRKINLLVRRVNLVGKGRERGGDFF